MHRGLARFIARRLLQAVLLVFVASSCALLLALLTPGDYFSDVTVRRETAAAERHRFGLDRPLATQYVSWLSRAVRLDFGTSLMFGRPVRGLVAERAGNTVLLGGCALVLATVIGIPLGTIAGSGRRGLWSTLARAVSLVLLSLPPLVTSLALLLLAATTGWFPVGGFPFDTALSLADAGQRLRHLALPGLALALPVAASLERLQAGAIARAMAAPSVLAARARGIPAGRVLWVHAMRLSLGPTLAVYGVVVGSLLSGSFVVEVVMSWPGLGDLMFQGLKSRDLFLVAGCAAAVAACLAAGVLAADIAFAIVDPRATEPE